MDARQELEELRRIDELERKAQGATAAPQPALPRTMSRGEQLTNHPLTKGAIGLAETGAGLVSGLGMQVAGGLSGAANVGYNLLKGKDFTDAMASGADVTESITSKAYQPQGAEGKALTKAVMYLPQKSVEGWKLIGGELGELAGNREAGEAIGGGGMEALMAVAPGPKMLKQAAAAAAAPKQLNLKQTQATYGADRQTPKQINETVSKVAAQEAAEAAQRHGIAIDLPDIDPGGKLYRMAAGPEATQAAMERVNKGKPETALKTAVGITPETPLDYRALNANLDRLAGPKKQIEAMTGIVDDGKTVAEIRQLVPERVVGMGKEHAAAINEINTLIKDISNDAGMGAGSAVIRGIETHRKAARDIYGRNDISPELRNTAEIHQGTANALERLLERRLSTTAPDLLAQYVKNREAMAQTYLLKELLDDNTMTVRLDKLANQTANDPGITGAFRDFGKIYANSPESFKALPKEPGVLRWSRYTIPGTIGAGFGTVTGIGPIAGAGLGVLAQKGLANKAANRLASPKHQAGYIKALRERSRADLGYEPVPPPVELAPRGPYPPSPTGAGRGTIVGTGPMDTGVINLAPQLNAAIPSEGMGPQTALRSGARDMSPRQTPQMPAVEYPLKPEMTAQFLDRTMDALRRGDENALARIDAEFNAFVEAMGEQSPHAAREALYARARSQLQGGFNPREMGPPAPTPPSAFSQALRDFQGAP